MAVMNSPQYLEGIAVFPENLQRILHLQATLVYLGSRCQFRVGR